MDGTFKMAQWSDEQFWRFERVESVINHYGYSVVSEPGAGQFDLWLENLEGDAKELEKRADWLRKEYGYRGTSKRLLAAIRSWPGTFNISAVPA